MSVVNSVSLAGAPLQFDLPDQGIGDSQYFMALHKAGSVLFYKIVEDIAAATGKPDFALETALFNKGVPMGECPLDVVMLMERKGFLYHGFRSFWALLPYVRGFKESKKLLLVRDPRDICVSYYFSMAKSHTVPDGGGARDRVLAQRAEANQLDVNKYINAGRCDFILNNMRAYKRMTELYDNCHVFRYEDVIFKKRKWIDDIVKLCGLELPTAKIHEIADRHDIRPSEERPNQHVRQVTPGNYKQHLTEETQNFIERRYKPVFEHFGYTTETC